MNGNIRIGRILGVEVSVNWSCLVLCVLLVWTLASGIFPSTNPRLSHGTDLAMAFAATAGFLAALLLHELGHVVVARRAGMQVDGITLWILGGIARFRSAYRDGATEVRVAFAGPLVSLILGGLAVLVALVCSSQPVSAVAAWLGYINLSLGVFNLLPAVPLDGGRVLHGLLWRARGDEAEATRAAVAVGRGFGYVLIAGGVVLFVFQGSFSGAWLAFVGWFLLEAATAELQNEATRQALSGLRVGEMMTRDPVTVAPEQTIGDVVDNLDGRRRYSTYPVVDGGAPVGLLPLRRALAVDRRSWDRRRVRDCMLELDTVPRLDENQPADDALPALGGTEVGHALVVSDGRLVGLLSTSDLTRVLAERHAPGALAPQ